MKFRQFINKVQENMITFMQGRYGIDELGKFLFKFMFLLWVLGFIFGDAGTNLFGRLMSLLILADISWVYFRCLSKNKPTRYKENERFKKIKTNCKNIWIRFKYQLFQCKKYHIYKCPDCKQKIRIPRGHGKIEVTCPKCQRKFIKHS